MKNVHILSRLWLWIQYVLRFCVDSSVHIPKWRRLSPESLLVVKTDAIGDFIIWLAHAEQYRNHFKGKRLVLVVNQLCVDLARKQKIFEDVIGIDPKCFESNLIYRYKMTRKIRQLNAYCAIQPTHSRNFWVGDSLVRASGAPERVGSVGNLDNMSLWQQRISNNWYTRLLPELTESMSEQQRNADFISALTGRKIQPSIARLVQNDLYRDSSNSDYFIIFPGAGSSNRMWPIESYIELAERIINKYNLSLRVCGSDAEFSLAQDLVGTLNRGKAENWAGKTNLPDFITQVAGARLLIANETSAVHIAAAVATPSICILGGGHFGRFVPYPDQLSETSPIPVYESMPCYGCNWQCNQTHEPGGAVPCITDISVDKVMGSVQSCLSRKSE